MLSIKWLIILLFSGCILFFIPNLVRAVMNESLKEGFVKIGANPWALAAFSDFTVGFAFNLTFICVREASDLYPIAGRKPSSWSAFFWVVLAMLVGNPAVLGYGIYQLVQAPSVQEAFIVRCATSNTGSDRMVSTRTKWLCGLFQAAMLGLFIYYLFCCVVALSSQSIGDGWQYIKSDPWAYLTFCDNLLGVVFTSVYMAMVLGGGSWKAIGAWWLALWWLGNGTTVSIDMESCIEMEQFLLQNLGNICFDVVLGKTFPR